MPISRIRCRTRRIRLGRLYPVKSNDRLSRRNCSSLSKRDPRGVSSIKLCRLLAVSWATSS